MNDRLSFRVLDSVEGSCLIDFFEDSPDIGSSISKSGIHVSDQSTNVSGPLMCELYL